MAADLVGRLAAGLVGNDVPSPSDEGLASGINIAASRVAQLASVAIAAGLGKLCAVTKSAL
jgi:hypothetical protein